MLDLRDLGVPVVGAPMAGGPSTPALAAAVSGAGGLGFLAAGYATADRLADQLDAVRATTTAAIGVNLFVLEPYEPDAARLAAYRRLLEPVAADLGVELGEPRWDDDDWDAKTALVLDARPAAVSFTFGCPAPAQLRRLAQAGVLTLVTVTTVAEGRKAAARGAAALAVQGNDAGAHRGTWDPEALPDTTPLVDLVAAVRTAVDVPVVAGGGLGTRDDVAAVLAAGATAALVGTAYLLADEADTNPVHRAALLDQARDETALTLAYTGRWARGLVTPFLTAHADAPVGYPHVHHLTAPLRRAAVAAGRTDLVHLWAGTGHRAARPGPAAQITASLAP